MKPLNWCWLMPMFLWPHIEGNVLPISSLTQPSLAQSFYSHSLAHLPFMKYVAQVYLPYESCFLFFSRRLVTLADSIFWWRFRLTHHKTVFSNILCLIDPRGCKISTGRIISSTVFTLKLACTLREWGSLFLKLLLLKNTWRTLRKNKYWEVDSSSTKEASDNEVQNSDIEN